MTLPSFLGDPLRAGLTLLLLVASACGTSDTGAAAENPTPNNNAGDSAVAECTTEGQTRVCQCTGNSGSGRKTCSKGKYGACSNCVGDHVKSDAAVLSTQDLCKAGYYEGAFTGNYRPGAFGGLGLGPSMFEVEIEGAPFMGQPPLAMTLSEADNGPAGEFHTYTVNGGCMTGVAHAVGTDNPFVARLEGNLDCATGYFVGTLSGRYTLLDVMGLEFEFKGPLTSQFVLPGTLKDGEWAVAEPESLLGGAQGGGDGGWSADWKSDMAPHVDVDPCADLPLFDGGTAAPSDGGAPSVNTKPSAADAGTPSDAGD